MKRTLRHLTFVMLLAAATYIGVAIQHNSAREQQTPHTTRGPQDPEEAKRQAWLRRIESEQVLRAAAADITIQSEMVTFTVAVLTAITLLFALLSRHLIAPMIEHKLTEFSDKLDKKFVNHETIAAVSAQINAHAELDETRFNTITTQLNRILDKELL